MKFAFFGSDKFSCIVLDELKKYGYLPELLVTTPDTPRGRKLILTPPEAKVWAEKNKIPLIQPTKLSLDLFDKNWDLFIAASYGKIIPQEVTELPKYQTLNVHPSLLPKLRGASPIQSAILGENQTGVSIIRIDAEMDHGPIVAKKQVVSWDISKIPDVVGLEELLAHEGGKLLAEVIPDWLSGEIPEKEQDHQIATYAKKLRKEDGLIDLSRSPEENFRKIQAFKKWPKSYFFIEHVGKQKRIIITEARFSDKLEILKVLPEGGKEISFEDFKKGYQLPLQTTN